MDNENLVEQIMRYCARMELGDPNVKPYDLKENGSWHVMGGEQGFDETWPNGGIRRDMGIYQGRFGDILASVLQEKRFYGEGYRGYVSDDAGNSKSGRIVKIEAHKVEESDILELLKMEPYNLGVTRNAQYFATP